MGLRLQILFPLFLAILFVVFWALAGNRLGQTASAILIAAVVVLLLIAAANAELLVFRPLRKLRRTAAALAPSGHPESQLERDLDDLASVAKQLDQARARMAEYESRLEHQETQSKELEQALRETRERYVLAVERANDGTWEWDLTTDLVQFSPRWKGMLGHFTESLRRIDDWKELIHPDDREAILMRLANHIDGLTPNFDAEYRLRHGDGRYRWLSSRGAAIRHASGKSYRMVMMDNDINSRKELEETLIQAAEGLSSVSGDEFFRALMRNLSAILGTRDNLVCYCTGDPPTRAHALAYYTGGQFAEHTVEYDLAGTSCGAVIAKKEIVYCPTGVCNIWPVEREYDRDSYLGVPMFDSAGKIIGHFACMDGKPMRQDLPHLALFKIFSVRAAAELERILLRQKLGVS